MAATATVGVAALTGCASTGQVAGAERADCPGKIVCPITGGLVCIDQCPAGAEIDLALAVSQPGSCCATSN